MLAHAWVSAGARGCPQSPTLTIYAAVSQEGGCQLNHLYSGVIHPWGVPTQPKINPRSILPRPRACAMSLASRYTAAAVYSRAYSFFVLYTGIQHPRLVTGRLQRSTALQRYTAVYSGSTVYSSTAVYSIQQSTIRDQVPTLERFWGDRGECWHARTGVRTAGVRTAAEVLEQVLELYNIYRSIFGVGLSRF